MPPLPELIVTPAAPMPMLAAALPLPRAAAGARCVSLLQLYRAKAQARLVALHAFGVDWSETAAASAPLVTSFTDALIEVVRTKTHARRLTLGTVLGGVACPFKFLALLRAGCEGAVVQQTFRRAMLAELGRPSTGHTAQDRHLLVECIKTLRHYFPADATVAHLVMIDPTLRHREECTYLAALCAPSSLVAWYGAPDFRRAAQAVYDAGYGPFAMLLSNNGLTAADLLDCLSILVTAGRARGWFTRGTPQDWPTPSVRCPTSLESLSGHWLALYETWHAPVGRLWKAAGANPTLWLPIVAEIVHSTRSISAILPDVKDTVTAWPEPARLMASALLATSSNPDTAALGRALQSDVHHDC